MSDIPTKTYPPAFLKALIDEAEAEALRRDARRYRWLRGMIYDDRIIVAADEMLHGEALDAVIDEAAAAATTNEDASGIQQGDTMSDIREVLPRLEAEVERLKAENEDATSHIAALKGGATWLEAENKVAHTARRSAEARLAEIERLRQEERQAAARERELARDTIDQLTNERDEAQSEVERLRADNDLWRQARNDALAGGDVLKAEVERLKAEVYQLTTERDEAQAKVERLTKQRGDTMSDIPTGWRPIESAPRDGTWILLWDDRACAALSGYWDADVDEWMTDVDVCDGDFLPTRWLSVPHPTAWAQR